VEFALKAANDKLRAQLKALLDGEGHAAADADERSEELVRLQALCDRSAQEASAARRELERAEDQVVCVFGSA
jgi:hypothetical protein